MGYEPKELTDEEWRCMMRLEEMPEESILESFERYIQELDAYIEEKGLSAIPKI